jgi:hypothetical protein
MRNRKVTMEEAYPGMISGDGIFSDLQQEGVPWASANVAQALDVAYYARSAGRLGGPYVTKLMGDQEALTSQQRATIAHMLSVVFGVKWTKLWDTAEVEYDPIENYRMVETETSTGSRSDQATRTGTVGDSGTSAVAHTGTVSRSGTERTQGTIDYDKSETSTGTNTDSVFGFNSTGAVPSDSGTASATRTNDDSETHDMTTTDSTTDTMNNTDTTTSSNTQTRNLSDSSEGETSTERELTRSGNIGVTTSQQMLQSERELWSWSYFDVVFQDIDRTLCLSVYTTN